jgi:HPt (histidine-containing phosphotransfer) domain-containing protein
VKFREDFRQAPKTVKDLVFGEKYQDAQILAHSIKGAGANVGAEDLQKAASELERHYKEGGEGLPELEYAAFTEELDRVIASLSALGETEESTPAAKGETTSLPPEVASEIATRLREAVELGDLAQLTQIASDLSDRKDSSSHYGEEISRLADDFDFDGLLELANTLEQAASTQ